MVSYDTYCLTIEACETYDKVLCIIALHFKEFTVVDDSTNHFIHVIRFVSRIRNDFIQRIFKTIDWVITWLQWSFFEVILWNIAEEFANDSQCFFAIFCRTCDALVTSWYSSLSPAAASWR